MEHDKDSIAHEVIFGLLIALVFVSAGARVLQLPPLANNLIIFIDAFAMTALVVVRYMGLRMESPTVKWTVAVPVTLFAILIAILLTDIDHLLLHSV